MSRYFGKGLRLYKREKLCNVTAIERLFAVRTSVAANNADSRSATGSTLCYPLRAVWSRNDGRNGAPLQFLVSVPKKRLHNAVDRVTMRRRIRDAYRLERPAYYSTDGDDPTPDTPRTDIVFIYVADKLVDSRRVRRAMHRILQQILDEQNRQ